MLANDSDDDGNPLTAILDTPPANGTLTLNSDGYLEYTPNPGFSGTDTFMYYASEGGTVVSNTQMVLITVYSVPVANPDQYTTPMGQTLNISAWGNGRLFAHC